MNLYTPYLRSLVNANPFSSVLTLSTVVPGSIPLTLTATTLKPALATGFSSFSLSTLTIWIDPLITSLGTSKV